MPLLQGPGWKISGETGRIGDAPQEGGVPKKDRFAAVQDLGIRERAEAQFGADAGGITHGYGQSGFHEVLQFDPMQNRFYQFFFLVVHWSHEVG